MTLFRVFVFVCLAVFCADVALASFTSATPNFYNLTHLLARVRQQAAPPALLNLVERWFDLKRRGEGRPPCLKAQDPVNTTALHDVCLNDEWITHSHWQAWNASLAAKVPTGSPLQRMSTSYPLLCNMDFAQFADFKCSIANPKHRPGLNLGCSWPRSLPNRSIIFVAVSSLKLLVKQLPRLPRFFLITHWADTAINAGDQLTRRILASPNLLLWFATSLESVHPRLIPIPIGLHPGGAEAIRELHRAARVPIRSAIVAKFYIPADDTQQKRYLLRRKAALPIYRTFPQLSPYSRLGKRKGFRAYYEEMLEHRFVVSPPGNNHDCYRTWEALSLGRVPIVKSFPPQDPLFLGLPVVLVDDWRAVTPRLLEERAREVERGRFELRKLTVVWWWLFVLKACVLTP